MFATGDTRTTNFKPQWTGDKAAENMKTGELLHHSLNSAFPDSIRPTLICHIMISFKFGVTSM